MAKPIAEPVTIRAEDIDPRHNWARALPALGTMGVDFEERVDYRRLHRYRLARTRAALEKSDLGALLVMDVNNIRYLTSTKIGEWERDKLCRFALLTRTSNDPILWDFGSAAVHHKLYAPWLKPENCKAGRSGLLRHPAFLRRLPDLLLPDLQRRPRDPGSARRLQKGARVGRQRHRADQAGREHGQGLQRVAEGAGLRLSG